ncbi:hypothetical protein BH09SUM1_BH09SUM1_15720 [soil metagenome]
MADDFHFPPLNYGCVQCGKSCEMFDEITIDAPSRAAIEAVDYLPLMPPGAVAFKQSPLHPEKTILCKSGVKCVFLGEDRLCGIHRVFGEETKPRTCRGFPFRYVETPGGVYVGLSFACTAVQQNAGPAVVDDAANLRRDFAISNSVLRPEKSLRLTAGEEISWAAYEVLEGDLASIIGAAGKTVGERLVAQAVYLDLYSSLLRKGRATDEKFSEMDALAALRSRYLKDAADSELFRIGARLRPSAVLQRAFLGLITAFRDSLQVRGRKPGRVASVARIALHYGRHALQLGRVHLNLANVTFNYADLSRVKFPGGAEQEALLQRYFEHALFRKDLLLGDSVWLGQRFMLMHYALIHWHAVGISAGRGLDHCPVDAVQESIGAVERHYSFHTTFGKLFENVPVLGVVLDSIVRKPGFARAMVG